MPIMSLVHATRPSTLKVCINPAPAPRRGIQSKRAPGCGSGGVLKDSTKLSNRRDGCCKTTSIVPFNPTNFGAWPTVPISSPTLARWMGYDSVWSIVKSCISRLVPNLDIGKTAIWTIRQYKKSCYQTLSPRFRPSLAECWGWGLPLLLYISDINFI
jgi:hypothetical protein